ncbi:flagellin [Halovulum sp. GXIMD14793]
MVSFPLPDLAQFLVQQRNSSAVRADLQRAGQEMSTGRRSDLVEATQGDLGRVFSIDRSLAVLEQQSFDLTKAQGRAEASQLYLETIQKTASPFGADLLAAVGREDMVSARTFATNAEAELQAVVRTLNGEFGGRHLFSGAAEDRPAMASAATIIAEVDTIISSAADATTALAAIDAYFDTPAGGFGTTLYTGATEDAAAVTTPEGERVAYLMRADAAPIRDIIKGLAISATVTDTTFGGSRSQITTLLRGSAQALVYGSDGVVGLRSEVGAAEAGIAHAQAYISTQKNALDMSRNDIVAVDVYDAAAKFAELETQLTAVYTVTSRLSSLSITNFLR